MKHIYTLYPALLFFLLLPLKNHSQNTGQVTPITSSITYQGESETQAYAGEGEYQIFYDSNDGVLDKPIIIIDGYDPGDARDISVTYNVLSYNEGNSNIADEARDLGYDVVVLNFPVYTRNGNETVDGGADYIQRNAFVLVELIEEINSQKTGNEELVVVGPSMGGLISRYALRYMEDEGIDHETRLWLSFDSPHLGANIPIGFQHLFNYVAYGPAGDETMQDLVENSLRSAAAKQMLIDHLDAHLEPGDETEFDPNLVLPEGAPDYRNDFQTELDALGYPEDTRNIAISNGSGSGTTTGNPGMNVIDYTFYPEGPDGDIRANIELHFTPEAGQTISVSKVESQALLFSNWVTVDESEAFSMAPNSTDGYDSAPGGLYDIENFAGELGNDPTFEDFFDALNITAFDFIPTRSSLGIEATTDWHEAVSESEITAFDAFYIPEENQQHVTLTTASANFARVEIFQDDLSVTNPDVLAGLRLKQNPVENHITILGTLPDAEIKIHDTTGRLLYTEKTSLEQETRIPVQASSGVYVVTVQKEGALWQTKVLVK